MAGRRLHRSGYRARTARQRIQLKNAQLASAKKRRRNRRIAVGVGTAVLAAGIGVGGVKYAGPKLKAKAAAYPYAKMTPTLSNTARSITAERAPGKAKIAKLKQRENHKRAMAARRQTPTQRAESQKRRQGYLSAYNERRRATYAATRSVSGGVVARKPRKQETRARKRKTD